MNLTLKNDNSFLEDSKKQHLEDFFDYTKKSKSDNSLKAYRFAWDKFVKWCYLNEYDPMNTNAYSPELLIGLFVSSMAKTRNLKASSLSAYLAGIRHHYMEAGVSVDTKHPEIRKAMQGIRRELGTRQNTKAPLTTENIKMLIDSLGDLDEPIKIRDKALILVGFAGAFRRSELVAIHMEHLAFDTNGVSVFIAESKTDQEMQGRVVDIPFAVDASYCPVRALQAWMCAAYIEDGPVFLRIAKGGHILDSGLGDRSVALILKRRCEPFGFSNNIAGHSLRAGHVTSSIKRGTPETWIMRQTGHKSINTLKKYERMNREFEANSAAKIGL